MPGSHVITQSLRRVVAGAALTLALGATATVAAAHGAGVTVYPDPTANAGLAHIVPGPDGALYFTQDNAYQIGRITTTGQISQFPVPESQTTVDNGTAGQGPDEIVSSGGQLWFLSDTQSRLFSMTTAGVLTEAPGDGYTSPDGPYVDDPMDGLAASDLGGVWTQAQLQDTLRLWTPDGGTYSDYPLTADAASLHPMTLGPDGRVAFGFQTVAGSSIETVADDGSAAQDIPVNVVNPAYEISSLAFSTNGTLWFTEEQPADGSPGPSGGAIGSDTPGAVTATATRLSTPTDANPIPHSLVAGPGGVMYFATDTGLGEISPGGQVSVASLAPYHPTDLAMGADGNLWFIDESANVIGEVAPAALTFTRVPTPAPTPAGTAPQVRLTLSAHTLAAVRARGALRARCALTGAGTCTVAVTIPAHTARSLELRVPRAATTLMLGHAARTLARAGSATFSVALARPVRVALARTHRLAVTVTATSSASGASSRTARHRITLADGPAPPRRAQEAAAAGAAARGSSPIASASSS